MSSSHLGTAGNDILDVPAGSSNNTLFGLEGNDLLDAVNGGGDNTLRGGDGDDELFAFSKDQLFGEVGNDSLFSDGRGENTLSGGDGNDTIFSDRNDTASGDAGDDVIFGGISNNKLIGGTGKDFFYLTPEGIPEIANEVLDFIPGEDRVIINSIPEVQEFSDLILLQTGVDTTIRANIGGTLRDLSILRNIQADTLTLNDFNFALVSSFSIASAAATEGSAINFTITRTGDAQASQSITVVTSLNAGDSASNNDFTPKTETITFLAGETQKTFTVATVQDSLLEGNETFSVSLSNPTNGAILAANQGVVKGTINNDDAAPTLAIASAAATEGNAINFTITRTGDAQASQSITVVTSLNAGDSASNNDFTPKTETITFLAGETQKTFTVATVQDSLLEGNETFSVSLSNPTNGAILAANQGVAKGTINNDDLETKQLIIRPFGHQNNLKDLNLIIPLGFSGNLTNAIAQDPTILAPDATRLSLNAFSLGAISFDITNLSQGANTQIQILLPPNSNINDYLKLINDSWQSFTFDGTTGAEFVDLNNDGTEDIILHLQDGGRGDRDGIANGVITDPSALSTSPPGLNVTNGVFSANTFADTNLQARWLSSPSNSNYEFGWLPVDDAFGGIDGLNPGNEGYTAAALARQNIIFNGRSSASQSTLTRDSLANNLSSSEGQNLGQLQNMTVETGFNIFYLTENGQTSFSVNNGNGRFSHSSDGQGYHRLSFTDSQEEAVQFELGTSALVTPGIVGNKVTASVELKRVSAYDNTFGMYKIDDLAGGLDTNGDGTVDLLTGQAGYAQAALQRSQSSAQFQAPENNSSSTTNVELDGGQLLGLFIIPNASVSDVLSQNPDNQRSGNDPIAYFSFANANPDQLPHMTRMGSANSNIFGFEDLFGLGDRDFNDLIASIKFQLS